MFWTALAIDAVAASVLLVFFFWGLADGSVSSFNIGLWLGILLAVGGVVVGSLRLRAANKQRLAASLAMVLALPAALLGLFFLLLIVAAPDWK